MINYNKGKTLVLMFPTSLKFSSFLTTKAKASKFSFSNQFKTLIFMRNRSFLTNLKSYKGPTRIENDTIGEIKVPIDCLWGAQTQRY